MSKLKSLNSKHYISENDVLAYFLYKWIDVNTLLVTIKFKLLSHNKLSWYYDYFSVSVNS
ncbi:hypothetical protein [Candidatus Mycoplasma haematominutum]|nr:hypothetical protein [Candidatus Mycoplasma haematominutum]